MFQIIQFYAIIREPRQLFTTSIAEDDIMDYFTDPEVIHREYEKRVDMSD
ncbi:MAG: hypothetical protein IPH32_14900 [Bacteroidetes bacterium]|nr:hypothetical protein [Bacteroidota bacterium]